MASSSFPPQPTGAPIPKTQKRWVVPAAMIIVVLIVLAIISIVFLMKTLNEPSRIISISHTPENPQGGEEINVTVEVENSFDITISYVSFFQGGMSGSAYAMTTTNGNQYQFGIGHNFSSGTEIWLIVRSKSYDGSYVFSDDYFIQVGSIERSNITSLVISNMHNTPENPKTGETIINVSADITSNKTILKHEIGYMQFLSSGAGTSAGNMTKANGNTYEFSILYIGVGFDIGFQKDTRFFIRIAAQDESLNTAISPTISFVVS